MNIALILEAVKLVGANTPAFIALFDSVKATLGEDDRTKVEAAYAASVERADKAHEEAQGL